MFARLAGSETEPPPITFAKCYGGSEYDYASSTCKTADGGCVIGGNTYSDDSDVSGNHGDSDVWVVKLDSGGNIQWQRCLGGTMGDYANSISQTADGGYIIGGSTFSNDGDVSDNHNPDFSDAWVGPSET